MKTKIAREASRLASDLDRGSDSDKIMITGALSLLSIAAAVADTNSGEAMRLISLARRFSSRGAE